MQLFNLLKQAQQNGPNESGRDAVPDEHLTHDSHTGNKED